MGLAQTRLRGVLPLTFTPPWALHVGLHGELETQRQLMSSCLATPSLLQVLDLGPSAHVSLEAPQGWHEVKRHTRQCTWSEYGSWGIGKTRHKQAQRFLRDEGSVRISHDVEAWHHVHALHVTSRSRKGLAHRGAALSALLNRLAPQSWTFVVLAHNREGECVASGGFVILPNQTCVYAFGGQVRSKVSGRASVAMLLAAMDEAQNRGCSTFDFGGSQDPGVDQFYAEFGASVVPMRRWIRAPWWFKRCFPRQWSTWTTPSRHF